MRWVRFRSFGSSGHDDSVAATDVLTRLELIRWILCSGRDERLREESDERAEGASFAIRPGAYQRMLGCKQIQNVWMFGCKQLLWRCFCEECVWTSAKKVFETKCLDANNFCEEGTLWMECQKMQDATFVEHFFHEMRILSGFNSGKIYSDKSEVRIKQFSSGPRATIPSALSWSETTAKTWSIPCRCKPLFTSTVYKMSGSEKRCCDRMRDMDQHCFSHTFVTTKALLRVECPVKCGQNPHAALQT